MIKLKIFETNYSDIYFDDDEGVLIARWSGFLQPEQVKNGCRAIADYVTKNQIKRYLSDHTELKALSNQVRDYLIREWFPEIENLGMEKIAVLVSQNAFPKASAEKIVNETQIGRMKILTCSSRHDCLEWLRQNEH